jgi:hypothetical protein
MPKLPPLLALVTAPLLWATLLLQFFLLRENLHNEGGTTLLALWRYFGFFTILTNIAAAVVLTRAAINKTNNPRLDLSVATSIAIVGIVYTIALRQLWNPQGLQKPVDIILHNVSPLLFLFFFLASRHTTLRPRDALYALIPPFTYLLYALTRGSLDHWYPYYFLDPTKLPVSTLLLNISILFLAFTLVALLLIAATKLVWRLLSQK